MNVWPPEELKITLLAIIEPIIFAPFAAWSIGASYVERFNNNQVISLGEFGNMLGFGILLLLAASAIIGFFYNAFNEENEKTKKTLADIVVNLVFAIPCVYVALTFVVWLLLKLFFKY